MTKHQRTIQLACPQCGTQFVFECWFVIDAEHRPDLLERCIADEIHDARCPRGHVTPIGAPILVYDPVRGYAVFSPPLDFDEEAQSTCRSMLSQVHEEVKACRRSTSFLEQVRCVPRNRFWTVLRDLQEPQPEGNAVPVAIMAAIDAPFTDNDMPRRIAMIETAMAAITRQSDPNTWAWLNERLASSLFRLRQGRRVDNLERAIAATEAAASVYTREAAPARWADQQYNLARLLLERETGDPYENCLRARTVLHEVVRAKRPMNLQVTQIQSVLARIEARLNAEERRRAAREQPPQREQVRQTGRPSPNDTLIHEFNALPEPTNPSDYTYAMATIRRFLALPGLMAPTRAAVRYRLGLYLFKHSGGDGLERGRLVFIEADSRPGANLE